MNRVAKGRRIERLCIAELKKLGWNIAFRSIHTRFNQIDYANLFDIVAINPRDVINPPRRKYIQVKSKGCSTQNILIKLRAWKENYALADEEIELWIYNRGEWKVIFI